MAQPTLVYSGTTVTLPYPQDTSEDPGINDFEQITYDGHSRVQRLYRKRTWTLNFVRQTYTTWSAIISLWETARTANAFPTFAFTEVFANASTVQVVVKLSAFTPFKTNPAKGDFSLTLVSVNPY